MTRRHKHHAQVVTAFVRIPEDLPEGKVRCNGCGRVIGLTKNGRTRQHRTPAGEPCAYQVVYGKPSTLDALPPVVVPPQPRLPGPRTPIEREPTRLDVGSECDDCGRWLPGERHVCGKCANAREQARRDEQKARRSRRSR